MGIELHRCTWLMAIYGIGRLSSICWIIFFSGPCKTLESQLRIKFPINPPKLSTTQSNGPKPWKWTVSFPISVILSSVSFKWAPGDIGTWAERNTSMSLMSTDALALTPMLMNSALKCDVYRYVCFTFIALTFTVKVVLNLRQWKFKYIYLAEYPAFAFLMPIFAVKWSLSSFGSRLVGPVRVIVLRPLKLPFQTFLWGINTFKVTL